MEADSSKTHQWVAFNAGVVPVPPRPAAPPVEAGPVAPQVSRWRVRFATGAVIAAVVVLVAVMVWPYVIGAVS